ncbi:MAG: extracellular solute-binding protein [Gemmatimonadetes bacterium]|nr:extracellular solute-binding protein [Gemmatimonadota bacterium]
MSARGRRLVALLAIGLLGACRAPAHTVVIYSNLPSALLSFVEGAFEDGHPDVDVRTVSLTPTEALDRLRNERARPRADVWWGAPSSVLAVAATDSLLAQTHPSWFGAVPFEVRDDNGRWIGSLEDPLVIAVNVDSVGAEVAPRDWTDLFQPQFRGKVLLPEPWSSEAGNVLVATRLAMTTGDTAEAWGWLRRMDAAAARYVANDSDLVAQVAAGAATVGVARLSRVEEAIADGDGRLAVRVPEAGTPLLVQGIAVVAGAPDPQVAAEFVEWTGDPGVADGIMDRSHLMPARDDVEENPPAWLSKVLQTLRRQIVPADTLAVHLPGWLTWWTDHVRGQ